MIEPVLVSPRRETVITHEALREVRDGRVGTRWAVGVQGFGMEGNRFDDLARALARGFNRRDTLKALIAGGAAAAVGLPRTRRAGAQQLVALGGRCSEFGADFECSQAGTPSGGIPVICSDNNNASDGAYNCCRNAGGVCSADYHCCGTAMCTGGVCGGSATGGQQGGSRALGQSCVSTTECSQTGGSVVCASNGIADDGAKNCCRNTSGTCSTDFQCCSGLFCINGRCGGSGTTGSGTTSGSSGSGGSLQPGATCTSSASCSQAGGSTVCADNGISTDGALNCCRNGGGRCSDSVYSSDCCGGLYCREGVCRSLPTDGTRALGAECVETAECDQVFETTYCADNGVAADGALNCCRYAGGSCDSDPGCCAGLLCVSGVCRDAGGTTTGGSSGGQLPPGSACQSSQECSQAGGSVVCASNGLGYDGPLNCCRYSGGACSDGTGCCEGLECVGGVCGGAGAATADGDGAGNGASSGGTPIGGSCTSDDQCSQEGAPSVCRDNGISTDGSLNCCHYSGHACGNDSHCCAGYLCIGGACSGA